MIATTSSISVLINLHSIRLGLSQDVLYIYTNNTKPTTMRFYKCIEAHTVNCDKGYIHIISTGDILIDSSTWYYRTVIVATANYPTKIIHKKHYPIYLDKHYVKLTWSELSGIEPHLKREMQWDCKCSLRPKLDKVLKVSSKRGRRGGNRRRRY